MAKKTQINKNNNEKLKIEKDPDFILRMSNAPARGTESPIYQMLPLLLFAAVTIMIVRLHFYYRPMSQFYWTLQTDTTQLYDFFSYNKMVFIVIMSLTALFLMIVSFISQSMTIKRTPVYIPMAIYSLFVIISYIGSDYKVFSLWGYNDRFEGTITLLCYMLMLFFAINTINSEKNVKQLIWTIAIMAILLSLLGITQAIGKDFFQTVTGQKLISPNYKLADGTTLHQAIDNSFANGELFFDFSFQNKEVYQTVYNINYVSFYLTILIPMFGMLFIRSLDKESNEPGWSKVFWGIICILLVFNLVYSKSSGGYVGLGIATIIAIIVLNKQLKRFYKQILVLIVISAIILGGTVNRWKPEIVNAFKSISTPNIVMNTTSKEEVEPASLRPWIDYIKTGDYLEFSVNGEPIIADFDTSDYGVSLTIRDKNDNILPLLQSNDDYYLIDDDRFYNYLKLSLGVTQDQDPYMLINTAGTEWYFVKEGYYIYYVNDYGYRVTLDIIDHPIFANHLRFGSQRGYIWSASIPLLKHTVFKGFGADTYTIVYPTNDYAWKYNATMDRNMIVDKPHNMYLQTGINTGLISLAAQITIFVFYIIQSIKLYWKQELGSDYLMYVGVGLFCGLTAFIVSALVDDSNVSVMPLFYSLLGAGFAVNKLLVKKGS